MELKTSLCNMYAFFLGLGKCLIDQMSWIQETNSLFFHPSLEKLKSWSRLLSLYITITKTTLKDKE